MSPYLAQTRNPGFRAGASDDQLGGCSSSPCTARDLQAQIIACRFSVQLPTAYAVARLCFGEAAHD